MAAAVAFAPLAVPEASRAAGPAATAELSGPEDPRVAPCLPPSEPDSEVHPIASSAPRESSAFDEPLAATERKVTEDFEVTPAAEHESPAPQVDSARLAGTEPPSASSSSAEVKVRSATPTVVETSLGESPVNYDEPGLLEVQLGEHEYRFDTGKQGTALCVSGRSEGTYRWGFLGEVRWDGRDLRSRAFNRRLLGQLSVELRKFAADASE